MGIVDSHYDQYAPLSPAHLELQDDPENAACGAEIKAILGKIPKKYSMRLIRRKAEYEQGGHARCTAAKHQDGRLLPDVPANAGVVRLKLPLCVMP